MVTLSDPRPGRMGGDCGDVQRLAAVLDHDDVEAALPEWSYPAWHDRVSRSDSSGLIVQQFLLPTDPRDWLSNLSFPW